MSVQINDNIGDLNINREEAQDFVDPWRVVSTSATGVDYNKLIGKCFFFFNSVIM